MAFKKSLGAEKRYRMTTGGGNSWEEEANFSKNNDSCSFNTDAEEILWRFYDKTPMTEPSKEGESMVGKRKSPDNHHEENGYDAEPIMDDFESDSDHIEMPMPSKRKQITESVLLEEQYKLCQDERRFFNQLIHLLNVLTESIVSQGLVRVERHAAAVPDPIGDANIEESLVSSQ